MFVRPAGEHCYESTINVHRDADGRASLMTDTLWRHVLNPAPYVTNHRDETGEECRRQELYDLAALCCHALWQIRADRPHLVAHLVGWLWSASSRGWCNRRMCAANLPWPSGERAPGDEWIYQWIGLYIDVECWEDR